MTEAQRKSRIAELFEKILFNKNSPAEGDEYNLLVEEENRENARQMAVDLKKSGGSVKSR